MKKFQHFSPYNGLQWELNGLMSKWEFHLDINSLLKMFIKK